MAHLHNESNFDVLKDLPIAIVVLNDLNDCVYANALFERLAFLSAGSALGKGWMNNLVAPSTGSSVGELNKQRTFYFENQTSTINFELFRNNGEFHYYSVTPVAQSCIQNETSYKNPLLLQNMLDFTDAFIMQLCSVQVEASRWAIIGQTL